MKITHNKKITASTEWDNGWSKRHDSNSNSDYYVFSCPKATARVTEVDGGAHAEIHFRLEQIKLERDFVGSDACDQAMNWAEKRIFSKDVVASTDVTAGSTHINIRYVFSEVRKQIEEEYDDVDVTLVHSDDDVIIWAVDGRKCSLHYDGYSEVGAEEAMLEQSFDALGVCGSTNINCAQKIDLDQDDLSWIKGLYWSEDWHEFTVTSVDPAKLTCEITEEWISEDTDKDCRHTSKYTICTDDGGSLLFVSKKYPEYMKFYAQNALNYDEQVPKEFNELDFLDDYDYTTEEGLWDDADDYTPSATRGDYSPSNPWDAPGMSIHDFI